MKKLINDPRQVVGEMLEGLTAVHPGLARLSGANVLLRRDSAQVKNKQVALISGGGSGHEPAHAGYVGNGMLSAAVAGEVFTSPSADSVFAAIKAVAGEPGVLLIVKNYTGDRLNFGIAAEMARAEGIPVETVIVADDIALAATHQETDRRGIAGTVFVHKIAGAAAAEGQSLAEATRIARETATAVATMGVSLSACIVPAVGKPSFTLSDAEMELGLGIHGEPGVQRGPLLPADALADTLLEHILSAHRVPDGSNVALMINNLGATPYMELAIVARRAVDKLQSRNINVQRVLAGTFMSSLEMAGVSLSVLTLNEERLRLLDAPTTAPAWPNLLAQAPAPRQERAIPPLSSPSTHPVEAVAGPANPQLRTAIESACRALIAAQDRLTVLDTIGGDGDLGITLSRGASAIQQTMQHRASGNPAETLSVLGQTLQRVLGGSSGPFYGVFFIRAAGVLKKRPSDDPKAWAEALRQACQAISELGGAKAGDRTMLDALLPFSETFTAELQNGAAWKHALQAGVAAAENGAEATAQMKPKRGRSSYLGERVLGHPDPGAMAVAIWLRAAASALLGTGS